MSTVSVYITTADKQEALKISKLLVKKRLAACANIISGVDSIYWWDDKVEMGEEAIIIAKTQKKHMEVLIEVVKSIHSYENPCIVSLPIENGHNEFIEWIIDNT